MRNFAKLDHQLVNYSNQGVVERCNGRGNAYSLKEMLWVIVHFEVRIFQYMYNHDVLYVQSLIPWDFL